MITRRPMAPTTIGWLKGLSLPSEWTESKVKYISPGMQAGDSITAESIEPAGTYPVYGGNGLRGYTEAKTHEGTHVLIGRQGALCGNVHLVSGEFWASEHAIVARPGKGVDPRWLAYLLHVMNLGQYSQTAAQPGIGTGQINPLSVPLPPFLEQRAIADYLDRETARIDTLIEEQQRLIEMLRECRASVIAAEFAEAATTPLRQVIEYAQTGPFGTQLTADEYVDGGVPVINPTHIRRGLIVPDDSTTVTPEKAEDLARYRLAVGDIVLGRKGEVDKSALVDRRSAGYVCGSDAMALRPNAGTIPEYLWWFLQSAEAHSQLEFWSVGATVSGLNQTTIRKVRIPLPDEQEQRRVASHLHEETAKIDTLIAETGLFLELSKERRAALITAAVTGQIDVREAA